MRLISFDLCPYVQRSVITLEEKGAEYDIEYIDLTDKPDWFLDVSPLGKVPVLQVEGTVLFESQVINEYLDETIGDRLHPAAPLERARHRAWIEAVSSLGGPVYLMMIRETETETRALAAKARAGLERIVAERSGPFFAGDTPCLVDAAAAPFLQLLHWMEQIVPDLGVIGADGPIRAWTDALLARPAVQRSILPGLQDTFVAYLKGAGSPTRQAPSSWIGTQAG